MTLMIAAMSLTICIGHHVQNSYKLLFGGFKNPEITDFKISSMKYYRVKS
jgi:hypothetical protein